MASGKVVHLPEDVHRCAKEYCERNDVSMTKWVSALIRSASTGEVKVDVGDGSTVEPVAVKPEEVTPVPVEKRRRLADLSVNDKNNTGVGSSPPFWTVRREHQEHQEQ
jgi:hypothetical protein